MTFFGSFLWFLKNGLKTSINVPNFCQEKNGGMPARQSKDVAKKKFPIQTLMTWTPRSKLPYQPLAPLPYLLTLQISTLRMGINLNHERFLCTWIVSIYMQLYNASQHNEYSDYKYIHISCSFVNIIMFLFYFHFIYTLFYMHESSFNNYFLFHFKFTSSI